MSVTVNLYTVPTGKQAIIRNIRIVNTDTVARTFQLFVNGTTVPDDVYVDTTSLAAHALYADTDPVVLEAGETIDAIFEVAAKFSYHIFGLERDV